VNKLYYTDSSRFITYNNYKSNKKNMPTVIFLHGLMSSMASTKAVYIANYCKIHDYNFITFDNLGHGESSGKFVEGTIGSWLSAVELVLNNLIEENCIIIGSSKGGWLALLAALKFSAKIYALICLAPAVDFTEENIWRNLTAQQKLKMQHDGWLDIKSKFCDHKYTISYKLIAEARNHLLLGENIIKLDIPIHLIHSMADLDVPYNVSIKLMEKISSNKVVLKLIKDGGHSLSRPQDLEIISHSLEEIIKLEK